MALPGLWGDFPTMKLKPTNAFVTGHAAMHYEPRITDLIRPAKGTGLIRPVHPKPAKATKGGKRATPIIGKARPIKGQRRLLAKG